MLAGLVRLRLGTRKARSRERSTTLKCTCAQQSKNNGKHKVNESVLTVTPPGHLRNLMHYPTISTQVNIILHHLRCNAGGFRPVKVRNEKGTKP